MKSHRLLFVILSVFCCSASWGQWPQFRGPHNDGIAQAESGQTKIVLPAEFSENKNIRWKIPIHDKGWSTPVIWDDQIWMTTATEDGRQLYALCVDRNSGKLLFDKQLFYIDSPSPLGNDVNTYASPSPIIEKGRVYVHFGSSGTACIDAQTMKTLWQRQDIPCNHFRGPASSPILFEDKLILTMDGADLQYQIALNKNTGETVWKTDRNSNFKDLDSEGKPKQGGDFRKAFSTPFLMEIDGQPRMVISSSYNAFCYDPRDGREIWRIDHDCYSNASMALYGFGYVFLTTGRGRPVMLAVRPEGEGDITKTNIQWQSDKGIPVMVSPILIGDLIYFVNNSGVISCLEAKTGELVWKNRLKGQYYASPVYADEKIFFCNTTGDVTVLRPGRKLDAIQINTLSDGFMSSPAVAGNALFLRSKSFLYRIERM